MKSKLLSLVFIVLIFHKVSAVTTYFNYSRFYSSTDGPYIETYFSVVGSSVRYAKLNNQKFQGGVELAWIFYQNEKIVDAKKYILNSAEIEDSLQANDFADVQRFFLKPGEYELEIIVADKMFPQKQFTSKTKIQIDKGSEGIFFSDVELIESIAKSQSQSMITKGGLDIVPYQSNFFSEEMNKLFFYTEIYNASKLLGENEKFVATYAIQDYNTNIILNEFAGFSKQNAKEANSILGELNIENLKSGNYNIVVELHNKENKVVAAQKVFIQRKKSSLNDSLAAKDYLQEGDISFEKKISTLDSLIYYVRTFRIIASKSETDFSDRLLIDKNEMQLRNYIHNFWEKRNVRNPELEFHKYNARVKESNALFSSTQMKGYRTDRGRVYIKYGKPDQRARYENEPSNYPYEIWQYYTINNVHNRKFVFYNPTLASNNYRLLHSDAIGETRNDNWKVELDSRSLSGQKNKMNIDKTNSTDYMGNQVEDNFNNPR